MGGKSAQSGVQFNGKFGDMVAGRTSKIWFLLVAAAVAALGVVISLHRWRPEGLEIQGAVIRRDPDPRREAPIADVLVTLSKGAVTLTARSDASGYFKLSIPGVVWPGQALTLTFKQSGYETLTLHIPNQIRSTTRRLIVASMSPLTVKDEPTPSGPRTLVSNIRVRYTMNARSDENIGSAARTFQVVNHGNIPCHHQAPCSPDGNWKATVGSVKLDAGLGSEFRNVRATCIAGPCPFTLVDPSGFQNGGRVITATALDWSDTATFLVEAEVFHAGIVSSVRETYPVIFGNSLHFTVPPSREGVSLEAELNGVEMVFPLGPNLELSWAECSVRPTSEADKAITYQCDLRPGFHF